MPSKTRRPTSPSKCQECGRLMRLTGPQLKRLIHSFNRSDLAVRVEDPADLQYLVELKDYQRGGKVLHTRAELLNVLSLHLITEGGGRCGVCIWTKLAGEAGQLLDEKQEVHAYNVASLFRTFFNSKLYRSAVASQAGAAA